MALTLNATAGAADANSYATIAEANTYHETRLHTSGWHTTDTPVREQALVWATRLLDQHIEWYGTVASLAQALGCPRIGARDRQGRALVASAIPQLLKDATAEYARWLLDTDRTNNEGGGGDAGVQAVKLGSMSVEFAGSGSTDGSPDVIPPAVVAMLAPLGRYRNAPASAGAVSLGRG